jgi:hypothetical protein
MHKYKKRLILFNMSFFNEFVNFFKVDDMSGKISVSMVVGLGAVIVGDVRVIEISGENILLQSKKQSVNVVGESLEISSLSKGEILIEGNVFKVDCV